MYMERELKVSSFYCSSVHARHSIESLCTDGILGGGSSIKTRIIDNYCYIKIIPNHMFPFGTLGSLVNKIDITACKTMYKYLRAVSDNISKSNVKTNQQSQRHTDQVYSMYVGNSVMLYQGCL